MTKPSHADQDAVVRSVMAERGDSGETPRYTRFFFYGGDFKGLRIAAAREGYRVAPMAGRDGVILDTLIAVDEHSFEAHSQRMQDWADEFGCEYDGWECQLMIQ